MQFIYLFIVQKCTLHFSSFKPTISRFSKVFRTRRIRRVCGQFYAEFRFHAIRIRAVKNLPSNLSTTKHDSTGSLYGEFQFRASLITQSTSIMCNVQIHRLFLKENSRRRLRSRLDQRVSN